MSYRFFSLYTVCFFLSSRDCIFGVQLHQNISNIKWLFQVLNRWHKVSSLRIIKVEQFTKANKSKWDNVVNCTNRTIDFNKEDLKIINVYDEHNDGDKNIRGNSISLHISSISQGEVIIGSDVNKR